MLDSNFNSTAEACGLRFTQTGDSRACLMGLLQWLIAALYMCTTSKFFGHAYNYVLFDHNIEIEEYM